jgi:trypsin-like peptidase
VVAGAQRIGVVLHDASRHEAKIVALDEYKDLALLKIEGSGFPTAAIGSSQNVEVMDHVMVLGFPLIESVGTEVSMSDAESTLYGGGARFHCFRSTQISTPEIAVAHSLMTRVK